MPAEFTQGFFVRVPAWHKLGEVLDDYPGREEAMEKAGHNWDVLELESFTHYPPEWNEGRMLKDEGWKSHVRSDNGALLHKSRDSFHRIPNEVPYDLTELLLGEGFKYETGITLKGGALCALTLLLDEPIQIPGDDSEILPYLGLSWAHDGTASLKGNSTSIRRVCANTVAASESEGERLGTSFSIRHTKNWRARVEDAKMAMQGVRAQSEATEALALELAHLTMTDDQVEDFIVRFTTPAEILSASLASERVRTNVATAQAKMRSVFDSPTIPEAHRNTGWGAYNAAVEYLDFLRPTRGKDGRSRSEALVQRTLLKPNRAKDSAVALIREVAKV